MTVTLSIKNVPEHVAQALRERAQRHHRSLQGELMVIVEAAAAGETVAASEPSPVVYRPAPASGADDLLERIDADLYGAGLAGGPWLSREAVHDRALQRDAATATPSEPARRASKEPEPR